MKYVKEIVSMKSVLLLCIIDRHEIQRVSQAWIQTFVYFLTQIALRLCQYVYLTLCVLRAQGIVKFSLVAAVYFSGNSGVY